MLYVNDQKTIKWLECAKGKDVNRPKTSEYAVVEYKDVKWLFVTNNFVGHAINQYDTKVVGLADARTGNYILNPISGELVLKAEATISFVTDVVKIFERHLGDNSIILHGQQQYRIPASSAKNPVYGTWAIDIKDAEKPEILFLGWNLSKEVIDMANKKYQYFVNIDSKYAKSLNSLNMQKIWTSLPENGKWVRSSIVVKDTPERRLIMAMPIYMP